MDSTKITFKGFLNCFKSIEFNILTNKKKEYDVQKIESVHSSVSYLSKMLQNARRELAKAYKSHKAGKLSIEELFDYEWHVSELEQQLKNIEDLNQE
jgi:hypothetical protein